MIIKGNTYIVSFNTQLNLAKQISLEEFLTLYDDRSCSDFYWIDVESEADEFKKLLETLSFSQAWEDFFDKPEIMPHIKDRFNSISFYLYDILNVDAHSDSAKNIIEIEHAPFLLILTGKVVISYHKKNLEVINCVKKDCINNFHLAGKSPAFISFLIIQYCICNYAVLNLANDNFLDSIETDVLKKEESEYLPRISIASYNILMLKKMNSNLHIILLALVTKRSHMVTPEAQVAFNHMLKDTIGIREAIDSSRDLLDSIINGIQAEASRQTSNVVQTLTMVSAIFLPLTLISGIYGMNFAYIPELHWHYGYFYALGLMALLAATFLFVFKRFKWI